MKKFKVSALSAAIALALGSSASAATVNYSTTTTGNRVVVTTDPFLAATTGTIVMGTMTNEGDFSTFVEFARSSINSNGAFPTGGVINGGATNNTAGAADFASKPIYLAIYTEGNTHAGIYKSTASYDAGITGSASQTFSLEVTSLTTAINPTANWLFEAASVNPQGTTGAAGNPPTNRTGIVFDLGAAVPEPSVGVLSLLALGAVMRRRR